MKAVRKGKVITTDGRKKAYESINAAKRASRKFQMQQDGGLGRGCMQVIK